MTLKNIVEKIFQMEEEMDLFNKQIDGVYFWELVRFNVVSQIAQKTGIYGQAQGRLDKNFKNITINIFNAYKNIFYKNPFFSTKYDIVFWGSSRRKLMKNGLWCDVYCDPVMENLVGFNNLLLESSYLGKHFKPLQTNNIKYLDLALFIGTLCRILSINQLNLSANEKYAIEEVKNRLFKTFNVKLDIEKCVISRLRLRATMMPVFHYLLNKIKPKIAIIVCSYGKETFIESCKQHQIPVVELQHGTISRYHTAYSFPGKKAVKRTFPDYFFSFGDYWKNLVDFPVPEDRVLSVGYPFFETQAAQFRHEPKLDQIIFVSQGTIGEGMSKFAVELKTRSDFKFDIIYKLHPGEYARWKKDYPWLIDSGINVVDDESTPLYELLAQSKALVGAYSTVVYEGLGLGLPTYLVDLPGIEYMDELIASGAATKVTTVDELITALDNPQSKPVPAERFFKPNALENISNALEEIMGVSTGKR